MLLITALVMATNRTAMALMDTGLTGTTVGAAITGAAIGTAMATEVLLGMEEVNFMMAAGKAGVEVMA